LNHLLEIPRLSKAEVVRRLIITGLKQVKKPEDLIGVQAHLTPGYQKFFIPALG